MSSTESSGPREGPSTPTTETWSTKDDLGRVGEQALQALGLAQWKVWYTDVEPETLQHGRPVPNTAYHVRFNVVTHDDRFLTLRLRVPSDHSANPQAARDWLQSALVVQIRADHL